ncbi:hypothetical protein H2201_005109 [Coniosporium apollinis]|uniref:Alpha/beta hydrolase fold-3 domain-containing protein n=1 Tax=Coniosporium apollinis TaxID=61459 RepID=A0ABQ9NQP4_9PEZI|nr:hypothetical protein H2201_005109 [Coniosporium apollinis]
MTPSFSRDIPTTVSPRKGTITLLFYTPKGYAARHGDTEGSRYPVLVNFHGGGFTIGNAGDDARWATAVVDIVDAVVVSVDYRLAPRYPFPTAVEDGVDAILYLILNAEELDIDPNRIGVSGFSAGGNLAFTVPLRLREELQRRRGRGAQALLPAYLAGNEGKVVVIVSWYPVTDFATSTRDERRKSNVRPDRELPKFMTNLFDASYLYPPQQVSLSDLYLSPAVAPHEVLRELPEDIIIYSCEWDGLRAEAERFQRHLVEELGKRVRYNVVPGVQHAWDRSPNPFKSSPVAEQAYREACIEMKTVFDSQGVPGYG